MKKSIFRIMHSQCGMIILVAVASKANIKRVVAILRVTKIRAVGDFQNKVKLIRKSMDGNAFFPAPPITVALNGVFDTDIKALDAAQTTALTRAKGAAQARDVAKQTVLNDIHNLQGYVQSIADANPAKAQQIIQSSGFDVRIATPRSKDDFSVKAAKVSGTIKLAVNVKKIANGSKRAFFKWQISTDDVTFTDLPSTLKGTTSVSGLKAGTFYYFRYMVVLKTGESGWSESASKMAS